MNYMEIVYLFIGLFSGTIIGGVACIIGMRIANRRKGFFNQMLKAVGR